MVKSKFISYSKNNFLNNNIHNLVFLSDDPNFQFGRKTGLLIEGLGVLRRTVMVVDQDNIIQYVDFVPGGGAKY